MVPHSRITHSVQSNFHYLSNPRVWCHIFPGLERQVVTRYNSEKYWNVCISSRTKSHYFSTCNSFLQCAFRSFLTCVLICGSATRSPCHPVMPSACPWSPERRGDCGETRPTVVHKLWGWVGMVCRRPSLQTSADGGRTLLV